MNLYLYGKQSTVEPIKIPAHGELCWGYFFSCPARRNFR